MQNKFCVKIFFKLIISNDCVYAVKTLLAENFFDLFQKLIQRIRTLIGLIIESYCLNKLFLKKLLILIKLGNNISFLIMIHNIFGVDMLKQIYIVYSTRIKFLVFNFIYLMLLFFSFRQKHGLEINTFIILNLHCQVMLTILNLPRLILEYSMLFF